MGMDFSRKLPIGIQDFEYLRKNGYLYIDKTDFIDKLVRNGKPYFLSRPRRFGKSLFVTTLEAYFLGKKDLFKGLAIEKLEEQNSEPWQVYPVMKFSLAAGEFTKEDGLRETLKNVLFEFEKKYGLESGNGLHLVHGASCEAEAAAGHLGDGHSAGRCKGRYYQGSLVAYSARRMLIDLDTLDGA